MTDLTATWLIQGGLEGANASATEVEFTITKQNATGWGVACGGPLSLAVYLPAGVTHNAAGHGNGFSNIL